MSLFTDLFAEVGEPLLEEQLGEQITYYFASGGDPATYTGVVSRQQISRRDTAEESGTDDVIHVSFSKTDGLGPDEPKRGDSIWRSGNGDASDKRYAFHGNEISSNAARRILEFVRYGRRQVGMVRR